MSVEFEVSLEERRRRFCWLHKRPTYIDWVNSGEEYYSKDYAERKIGRVAEIGLESVIFTVHLGGYALWNGRVSPMAPRLEHDLLQGLVKESHKRDIKFIAAWVPTVPGCALEAKEHPDWIFRRPDGKSEPIMCFVSPYRDYLFAQVKEVLANYEVDGIYFDYLPVACFCSYCQDKFKRQFGVTLPTGPDVKVKWHRVGRALLAADFPELSERFVDENIRSHLWNIRKIVDKMRPKAAYIQGMLWNTDLEDYGKYVDGTLPEILWSQKGLHELIFSREITKLYSGGLPLLDEIKYDQFNARFRPLAEAETLLGQCTANGNPVLFRDQNSLDYSIKDRGRIIDSIRVHSRVLKDRCEEEPLKFCALLHSRVSEEMFGDVHGVSARSIHRFLMENHILYTILSEKLVQKGALQDYRVVVLADAISLADETLEALTRFVEGGGGLVAIYKSGFLDAQGRSREKNPLGEICGFRYISVAGLDNPTPAMTMIDDQVPIQSMYSGIFNYGTIMGAHPVTEGLDDTYFSFEGGYIEADYARDCQVLAWVLAMDQKKVSAQPFNRRFWWPGEPVAPFLTVREKLGRTAYFAAEIGPEHRRSWSTHIDDLLRNAILWAAKAESPLTVENCPPSVRIVADQGKDGAGFIITLTNLTVNQLNRGNIRYIVPITDISLKLKVGEKQIRMVRTMREQDLSAIKEDDQIIIRVPRLEAYETIYVDTK